MTNQLPQDLQTAPYWAIRAYVVGYNKAIVDGDQDPEESGRAAILDAEKRGAAAKPRMMTHAPDRYSQRHNAVEARVELVNFRAYLAVQRERITPAIQGDLREFARTLYGAYHDRSIQRPAT